MKSHIKDVSPAQFEGFLADLLEGHIMPARKIGISSYSNTGYIPSTKGPRIQRAESLLEQEFLTLIDYDSRVQGFQSQPFTIRWKDSKGRWRDYTPDLVVTYTAAAMEADPSLKTTVFELKIRAELRAKWEDLKPKLRAGVSWAKLYGCRFSIVTEKEVRTPYLVNVQHLTHYRSIWIGDHPKAGRFQRRLLHALQEVQIDTPRGVLTRLSSDPMDQGELLPWLWNLVTQNLIGVDLTVPLTMASPIWLTEKGALALRIMQ